jgi:hypothetical protein
MSDQSIDPEHALPWQKLAAALADLLRSHVHREPDHAGLNIHEARVQAVSDMLVAKGTLDPAELEARMASLAARLAGDRDRAHPKTRFSNAAVNDIGGLPGGPIDTSAGCMESWEMLAIVLSATIGQHGLGNLHERRRAVEELGDDYNRLAYFERMVQGAANVLYEKEILTRDEVERKITALRKTP